MSRQPKDYKTEKNEALTYAITGCSVAISILIATGWTHGYLAIVLALFIAWRKWERAKWREEQRQQGINPDAEWRPWLLKKESKDTQKEM